MCINGDDFCFVKREFWTCCTWLPGRSAFRSTKKMYYDKHESVERVNQTMAERRGMWLLLFWSPIISLARCQLKEVSLKKNVPSMQWYTETRGLIHICNPLHPSPHVRSRHVYIGISQWVCILCSQWEVNGFRRQTDRRRQHNETAKDFNSTWWVLRPRLPRDAFRRLRERSAQSGVFDLSCHRPTFFSPHPSLIFSPPILYFPHLSNSFLTWSRLPCELFPLSFPLSLVPSLPPLTFYSLFHTRFSVLIYGSCSPPHCRFFNSRGAR